MAGARGGERGEKELQGGFAGGSAPGVSRRWRSAEEGHTEPCWEAMSAGEKERREGGEAGRRGRKEGES